MLASRSSVLTFLACIGSDNLGEKMMGSFENGTLDFWRPLLAPPGVYVRLMRLSLTRRELRLAGIEDTSVFVASEKADNFVRLTVVLLARAASRVCHLVVSV